MGSGPTTRRWKRLHLFQVSFVVFALFAAGLVSAGVVSGAGPLAVLSTGADTPTTTETTTTTTEESTTDSTDTTTTETEPTESTTTETSPIPTAPPTLVSDKDDYTPGETVTLTGENWAPAELVHIFVNDDEGKTWSRNADVIADGAGRIRDQFQLPATFVAIYSATATGPISGTASTTFRDGNIKVRSASGDHFNYTVQGYTTSSTCGGTGGATVTHTADGNGQNEASNSGESLLITANLNANAPNGSKVFLNWSNPNGLTITPSLTSRTICVAGFATGTRDLIGNYTAAPANTAPTANNVSDSTSEDTPKAIALSGSDAQQCELTFSIVSGPTNGAVGSISNNTCASGSPNADTASVTYTPNANFSGSDSFTYKVNDGSLDSNVATASITVNAVDDAPTAVNDSATVNEDSGANAIDVLANDTDPDGGPKSIQSVTQPANGTVAITGGGTGVTYAPNANYCNGGTPTDNFTYTLNGGSTATVSVTVTCIDDAPTAVNDAATVNEDSGANAIDVLANDTDPDGGPKSIQSVTQPANGTVAITGGGSGLTYAPNANYCNGGTPTDTFTYTLNGGSTATVSVTVTCVDDPPVITFTSGSTSLDEGATETYVFSITDPDSTSFTYDAGYPKCGIGGAVVGTPTLGTTSGSFQCKFADGPASPTVAAQIRDATSASNEATRGVTVNNVDPAVTLTGPASASEGGTVSYSYTFTDPGADSWTHVTTCGANGTKSDDVFTQATKSGSFKCSWADNYASQTVSAKVDDDDGGSDTDSIVVVVNNVDPAVTLTGPASASEGQTRSYSFTFTDPGADTWTRTVSCGSSGTVSNSSFTPATKSGSFDCLFTDDNPTGTPSDTSVVTATVADDDGGSDSDSVNVTVSNVAPVITSMTGPSGPIAIGGSASVTTNYTDVGTADTHTCEYSWDDGSPNTTAVGSGSGTGSCTATHPYAAPGVYTVGVVVRDDDTGSATSKYEFVVVFDPSGGFVTGGGWINSPAGAYRADTSLSGKANFGFVSKYRKGATVPEGQTEFQLHFASFNFHSTVYQWLVVSANGTKAQYKGDGKINGGGDYGFLLTAYDGSPDRFRIKIWDKGTSAVVYDNRIGVSEDIDAADPQEIAGGSIVIHRGK